MAGFGASVAGPSLEAHAEGFAVQGGVGVRTLIGPLK